MGREEIGEVLEVLRPDRIGHGILAAGDDELMRELREAEVVLEICPTSNLLTKALADEAAVRDVFRAFVENGVRFTIATDGPEMMRTHLRDELDLLLRIEALTQEELDEANARGHDASFVRGQIPRGPGLKQSNTPIGRWWPRRRRRSVVSMTRSSNEADLTLTRAAAPGRRADRARVLERGGRGAARHLGAHGEGALRCAPPEAGRAAATADPCRLQDAHR